MLSLSFIHNDDAYTLELEDEGTALRLVSILRYFRNENVEPTGERFSLLDRETREVIVSSVRRKWKDKTLKIL